MTITTTFPPVSLNRPEAVTLGLFLKNVLRDLALLSMVTLARFESW